MFEKIVFWIGGIVFTIADLIITFIPDDFSLHEKLYTNNKSLKDMLN